MVGADNPLVSVVIATRGRPVMLRAAVASILAQDYSGALEVLVVFDQTAIDELTDVVIPQNRAVKTIGNSRTPGLAGGRNSGISSARGTLVAFCDDDDEWMLSKLSKQVALLHANNDASIVGTGLRIQTSGSSHVRLPPSRATFTDFLSSRLTEIHPSSFLLRRSDLVGRIGLIDEELPASYGEDYDLLLRAARHGDVLCVVEPLIIVHWNRVSFFSERWAGIAGGLSYLLRKHTEFESNPRGAARIEGQIAFAHAALGDRDRAREWSSRALRHDRRQLRAWAARLVAWKLLPPAMLVRLVNRTGRGL